tara:strand:+ start:110 stop:445 length:336 start_codon:yes stop_codon:yes gene_type:complete
MNKNKFRSWSIQGKRFWYFDIHTGYNAENSDRFAPAEQSIVLKDNIGVDFYIGDVGEFPNGDRFIIAMEEWLEVSIQWIGEPECEDQAGDLPRISKATIIGNIHQNPELIK